MELELKDYVSVLRRRKKQFILVAALIFLLSVMFALRLSNYRSTATVEIAPPEVSAATAAPAGMSVGDYTESLADLRISHLQQKVLSTATLIEVITKFDLYANARKTTPIAEIADMMRKKIRLDLVSSTLANPSAQHASADASAAIAFNLSFDYSNPLLTQQVTNELVSRFLDEDLKDRRTMAHQTSAFLDGQIKALESSMGEQEKKIAEFRSANEGADPEYLNFNQQAAQSMQLNIQNIDSQISANVVTQGTLRGQLATLDPYSRVVADGQLLTTPTIQLKALQTQFATLSAQYGPEHPDVVKVRNQIHALEKQVGHAKPQAGEIQSRIEDAKTNLAAARQTYGAGHPDVVALQRKLTILERQLEEAQSPAQKDAIIKDADNPTYLQIASQLKSSEEQYNSLLTQKDSLLEEQKKYHKAISKNPEVVQKMAELTRDYENSQLRYRTLKEKKMSADMNETIEVGRSGQRLILLNPPELPLQTQPGRKLFIIGGFVLALIGGLGSVVLSQMVSQSVVGPRHLESLVGVAPLVTIPYLVTEAEENGYALKRYRLAGLTALAAIILLMLFSSLVMPLDVVWEIALRKLGLS